MRYVTHIFLVCFAILLMTGCASSPSSGMPVADPEQTFDRNQDKLSNLPSWQFDGRFSIRSTRGVDNANLAWLQESTRYLLKISGPLQQGAVFIRGDQGTISYKDSKGVTDHASSPEALLARHTHYDLPVSSMRYWVLGLPDPRYPFELNIASNGDIRTLTQQGWNIRYQAFKTVERYRLPTKLTMKHDQAEVILSIHEWNPDLSAE